MSLRAAARLGAFPEHEATVIGTVLLYLLAVPYERWRKQVACAQPHVTNS